jgi:isoleucyl-tRNA synthetase/very-short-patch-repair endonuclease
MYKEFSHLDLPAIDRNILAFWEEQEIFRRSIEERPAENPFVFYEGPPSANGLPGIHHVMARTIKDIFCRYQTLRGKRVERKGGWDTHGLPIELKVESELGITKEDIGTKISVDDYNQACRETVMRFKDRWDEITRKMGYWVDLDNPYITYEREYMESVWWLLKQIYDKGLIYKGYTIQPYSPAAGTGLSSHELNMPGAYQDVTDTTVVAMFRVIGGSRVGGSKATPYPLPPDTYLLAWTTTPWTLPSNTALTVGKNIDYVRVKTTNPYTDEPITVVLAEGLVDKWFGGNNQPVVEEQSAPFKGSELVGLRYEQLLPGGTPDDGDAFRVIAGDFVTTEAGTGIVHTAPSFGADDMMVGRANGIGSLTLVDKTGKFTAEAGPFAGRYVKNYKDQEDYVDVNVDIAVHLKKNGRAFNVAKYNHSYPHCWRTDKPVLYYPLDSWFIKASAVKERMQALNATINWQPASTGEGRFGKWLENLQDWNLSRSRYWGIPLPIWRSADGSEEVCVGSVAELEDLVSVANRELGLDQSVPQDLHRPYIDEVVLWKNGKELRRELDLIDVWFDSGSMPYAQWGFPNAVKLGPGSNAPTPATRTALPPDPQRGEGGPDEDWPPVYQTAHKMSYSQLKEYATAMRHDRATPAENRLWEELKTKKLNGYKFRRQHIIGHFIVDFVCLKKRLIVEVDGSVHDTKEARVNDRLRTQILATKGWRLIRFTNDQVLNDMTSVIQRITQSLAQVPTFTQDMVAKGLHQLPPFAPADNNLDIASTGTSSPFGGRGANVPVDAMRGANQFPADFIAEGVDQTRGWFYTLHAIATMVFDSVAYKNVVSNGLVLDKEGKKMSKRLGNAVDPFLTIDTYGADATRWYMIGNSDPWDNLKFDLAGIQEVQRRFFGTLYNTYGFFALYANIDGYDAAADQPVAKEELAEIDRWVLSRLNTLTKEVNERFAAYDATPACRAIDAFVNDELSNWYVRQSRRRFWRGEMTVDKRAAYQTLHTCLVRISQLMSPVAPFFADWLYRNLGGDAGALFDGKDSVHLTHLAPAHRALIDEDLEKRMAYAQRISSLVLSLRKREKLRVRQPLQKILVPALDAEFRRRVSAVAHIIRAETNIREVEFLTDDDFLKKTIKPNFRVLGKRLGKRMKQVAGAIGRMSQEEISALDSAGSFELHLDAETVTIQKEEVDILTEDIPGWKVATDGELTVALDVNVTPELAREGLARELVSRIQNLRKDSGLEVTDRIALTLSAEQEAAAAVETHRDYIMAETLAETLNLNGSQEGEVMELPGGQSVTVALERVR